MPRMQFGPFSRVDRTIDQDAPLGDRGMRRPADALKAPSYIEDKNSGELRRPHHIDLKTGMYRGRQVLTPKESA